FWRSFSSAFLSFTATASSEFFTLSLHDALPICQIVAVDWPGWATGTKEGLDGVTMLSFAPEKSEYQVREKVKISIPSSAGGRALVSLESGSKVLKSFWVPTNEGSTLVEFDAAAEMAPNIYAHIMLIQPHAQTL